MSTNKKQYTNKAKPAVGGGKRSKKSPKTKKSKVSHSSKSHSNPTDSKEVIAYCPGCKKKVPMVSFKIVPMGKHRQRYAGKDGAGHNVSRII